MVTVKGSKRNTWSLPYFSMAYICMTMDGMDDLTEVTAILSPSFKSSMDFKCGARVFRYMGIELMAATPLTLAVPLVRSHKSRKDGGPAEMKSAEPDSKASIITEGPPIFAQLMVTFCPAFSACFSISLCSFII